MADENPFEPPVPYYTWNIVTPNNEWKKVAASLSAAVLFTLLCIGSYTAIDGMDGGYALAFITFFLAISSIAVALLFFQRARAMDAILADPTPLAHWIYPDAMARAVVERDYHEYRERNRAMFLVIGGMLVVVALFFIVFVGEGGPETGMFLLAFTALLFGVSRLTPWLERRRAMHAPREAFITHQGIIFQGTVYPFRTFLISRPQVAFEQPKKKEPAKVVFSFTQLVGLYIVRPFDVAVPVPMGEEEKGARIVRELGGDTSLG